ncbi:MAG: hypothetical protein KatS3mg009_2346 [Acidimicrobiia bacterium]|nr:MAG: hypothetical protein KatS3mg009_2346 [Acidimicrobiia bacterium]
MPYEVSTPVFEGPFDLLLHLILKEEVDLWEISLAAIVDAFCAEVEQMERVDLDAATEFLLIAATLVELKARRLLPGRDDVELDEELARFEERDLLLARLLECKTFQDAARGAARPAAGGVAQRGAHRGPGGAVPVDWPPTRSSGCRSTPWSPRRAGARARARTARCAPTTSHRSGASVRDAIETVLALLPRVGRDPVPRPHRRRGRGSR